jgi:type IV secretory pathway VirB10-like protein
MADERDNELEPSAPHSHEPVEHDEHYEDGEDTSAPERGKTAAPSGVDLDLHPKPQGAVRVKKSIGLFVALGGFVLLMVIALAIATHKGVQPQGAGKARPTQSAAALGPQMSAKMQEQARQAKVDAARANGTDLEGSETPGAANNTGDVGDDLNVPPMKVVARNGQNGVGRAGGQAGGSNGPRPLTAQEQAAEDAYKAEQAAMNAPMAAKAGGGGGSGFSSGSGGSAGSGPGSVLGTLTQALARNVGGQMQQGQGGGLGGSGGGLGGGLGQTDDQNKQSDKSDFVAKAKANRESVYLKETRVSPLTQFEIKAGWDIPATLEQAVNSDLPGEVRGLVRENVYDTATGHYLLIPQGSRVIGTYNHRVAYGQTGIQVVWTRLIYPDGTSINLEGMMGEDARGQSGFRDKVDNHYARLVGFAILTSAFSAGIELTQNQSQTGYPTTSQTVTQALGQQLGELGITITNRNLNIQPTIKISVGYRFNIRVDRDIAFPEPYAPERVTN